MGRGEGIGVGRDRGGKGWEGERIGVRGRGTRWDRVGWDRVGWEGIRVRVGSGTGEGEG